MIRGHFGYEGLVGTSEAMRRVYALIDRVKDTDVPVLITGESGTGKEVVARAVHNAGPRGKKPFLGINCGAIPEHLLESELFGHVRGAFTGADRDRKGLFREATGGSILLDEIGEMPPRCRPASSASSRRRWCAPSAAPARSPSTPASSPPPTATSRPWSPPASSARTSTTASTSSRSKSPRSASASRICRSSSTTSSASSPPATTASAAASPARPRSASPPSPWPGNVRQLENVLLNAWVLSDRPELEADDFELPSGRPPRAPDAEAHRPPETSLDAHKAGERERILSALARCNWNRVQAAKLIGLPRRTFYRRLKEYGIQ